MTTGKLLARAGILLALVSLSFIPAAAQSYTVTDLGTLGGAASGAASLNSSGQVTGFSSIRTGEQHAFIWSQSIGLRDLGALPGYNYSYAEGINDAGEVVGFSFTTLKSGQPSLAFKWISGRGMQSLGTLGGDYSYAYGINSLGQVVGNSATTSDVETHAVMWNSLGEMSDLGTLGGKYSYAQAINDAGEVVGYSTLAGDVTYHAFLWTSASGMQDLGVLDNGTKSFAYGINSSGQVVGFGDTNSFSQTAFLWTPTQGMQVLGAGEGSVPFSAIAAQIVGSIESNLGYGFLWTPSHHLQNLNDLIGPHSTWGIGGAHGINKHGQIAAGGNGRKTHALLLTPTK